LAIKKDAPEILDTLGLPNMSKKEEAPASSGGTE
jgi:hypothetical protein